MTTILVLNSVWVFSGILFLPHKLYTFLLLHQTGMLWDTLLSLMATLVETVIVIYMWKWKKIAVYAHFSYLIVIFASLTAPIFLLFPENQVGAWMMIMALVILGVQWVAIKPKWSMFT